MPPIQRNIDSLKAIFFQHYRKLLPDDKVREAGEKLLDFFSNIDVPTSQDEERFKEKMIELLKLPDDQSMNLWLG
jgi:hypothetical protein